MVQLGFSTSIPGINKPSVEGVKGTQLSNFTQEQKDTIKQQIVNPNKKKIVLSPTAPRIASTSMVGLVKPKREDERQVTNAAYEIAKAKVTGSGFDSVMENYYGTLSEQGFEDARNIASDLVSGSGAKEMATAYSTRGFSPEEIEDIHYGFSLLQGKSPMEGIGEITDEEGKGLGIGTIAGIGSGILAGVGLAGKTLKKTGKYIYKNIGGVSETVPQALAMKEGRTQAQEMFGIKPEGASLEKVRTTPETALERGGVFKQTGGNITRATTAKQTARRIWANEVKPVLDSIGGTIGIKDIEKEAKSVVKEMPNVFKSSAYSEGVKEVIDALKKTKFNGDINKLSANQLQDLRSHIMTMDIPQSAYRGVEVKESFKQGAMAIVDAMKRILNKGVEKIGGDVEKFKTAYADYGNLVDMSETMAKKAGVTPSQNLQQILSSGTGKPLSAVSTFAGKGLYKLGKGLEIPLDLMTGLIKGGVKVLKKVVKGGSVFSMLEDGTLIPGSPTNIITKARDAYKNMSPEEKKIIDSGGVIIEI